MGRPADENLPEVLPNHPTAAIYSQHPLPEVVPDSSPEAFAGHPPHYSQEKYPAFYDDAPKLPHDPSSPGAYGTHGMPYSPGQSPYNYPSTPGDPVSAFSPNSSVPWQRLDSVAGGDDQRTFVNSEPEQEKRICGIKRKIFLIVAGLLAVIIIAAAVGGGVGAAMSKKSNSDNSSDEPASETQSASPVESGATTTSSTPTTTSSATSTTEPTLSATMLGPMEYGFQGFSGENFTGKRTQIIIGREGRYDFGFDVVSYLWYTKNSACCHTYCADEKNAIGWHCDQRLRDSADEPFPRLAIWCGGRKTAEATESWRQKCSAPSTTTEITRRWDWSQLFWS